MNITITPTERDFDVTAAWRIISQMLRKPYAVIGLSTGQTTMGMHKVVSDIFSQYPFDVSRITLFNVDELTNLPREYSGSCYTMIKTQLADPLGIPEENFIMPPTLSEDFEAECRLFEKRLAERGGADLQMLGI
ncbi:MAG TPA: 6-phosphogluconolactonase, partial [Bacteroidales bacterium]|nr:6-phosphogluconolactonase [Bacteroidales bacterium]